MLASSTGGAAVVTCGEHGAVMWREGAVTEVPAIAVQAIDTVAAGDAFCGVLAAALAERRPVDEAVRRATAAGAHAATVRGALPSLPTRAEVERLLERRA